MDKKNPEIKPNPTICDLYPNLTEDQLKEAEENLDRYLEIAIRIYKRLENDLGLLTASNKDLMIGIKRSNPA